MNFSLVDNQQIKLAILAHEEYSSNFLDVKKGELYKVWCEPGQRWTDWFITTTPKGFFNFLASIVGLRVKGVKCLCLCAAFDKKDETAFKIGDYLILEVPDYTKLYFFANDSKGYYKNNKGSIDVYVQRLR
ncbi:hypothetical protein [Dyadobacter sp. LHD-138]|uniref:hypothetical protein n=1 Tax=Dyadobacter sp. LHD-138 TaxID=3071413 RepID=UPI0027E05A7A|nr:hypothetical protein [Dyadobacter sp. LHD-138]MDQ6482414.1 hypothetical protein [Dyadobacter sp. LHD-138]